MSGDSILLVEDALSMQMIVQSVVGNLCALTCVTNLNDADIALRNNSYSLILLDVELPDGNGFDYCRKLKSHDRFRDIPIIFLTGKAEIDQRVLGFSLGADDYIVKPLEPKEFVARIESKLKRKPKGELQTTFCKSDFKVDLTSQRVFLLVGNKTANGSGSSSSAIKDSLHSANSMSLSTTTPIENGTGSGEENSIFEERELGFTPIEFKLLVHFLRNEGSVLSREELLRVVWGESVHISSHTIDAHISSLRKKISSTGHHLRAIVKKGYCFSLNPSAIAARGSNSTTTSISPTSITTSGVSAGSTSRTATSTTK